MNNTNLTIRPYQSSDEQEVIDLWNQCGLIVPWNDPKRDIALKLQVQPDLFLVGLTNGRIVTAVMAGYDGHRGWLNYVAVSPNYRRYGIGRLMIEEATARLTALGCPKINLQVRATNSDVIAFYEQLGFAVEDVISMGKRL